MREASPGVACDRSVRRCMWRECSEAVCRVMLRAVRGAKCVRNTRGVGSARGFAFRHRRERRTFGDDRHVRSVLATVRRHVTVPVNATGEAWHDGVGEERKEATPSTDLAKCGARWGARSEGEIGDGARRKTKAKKKDHPTRCTPAARSTHMIAIARFALRRRTPAGHLLLACQCSSLYESICSEQCVPFEALKYPHER